MRTEEQDNRNRKPGQHVQRRKDQREHEPALHIDVIRAPVDGRKFIIDHPLFAEVLRHADARHTLLDCVVDHRHHPRTLPRDVPRQAPEADRRRNDDRQRQQQDQRKRR